MKAGQKVKTIDGKIETIMKVEPVRIITMEIKNRFTNEIIASGNTLIDAIKNCNKELKYANLRGANLRGADLTNIKINWMSHDLITEILRQNAENNILRRQIAGLILISRDWCWEDFLKIDIPEKEWALEILRQYETDDNKMPNIKNKDNQETHLEITDDTERQPNMA